MNVIKKIRTMLTIQYLSYFTKLLKIKKITSHEFLETILYSDIVYRVTFYALWKIHDRYQKLKKAIEKNPLSSCRNYYIEFMSLSYSEKATSNWSYKAILVVDKRYKEEKNSREICGYYISGRQD